MSPVNNSVRDTGMIDKWPVAMVILDFSVLVTKVQDVFTPGGFVVIRFWGVFGNNYCYGNTFWVSDIMDVPKPKHIHRLSPTFW